MAIDLAKMRQKYQTLRTKGGGNKDVFWRPQDGEQTIRILPTPDGDPFKEYWFHYNLGTNPSFLSPKKNFGESDPLDDFVRQLYKEGSDDSIKMAKSLSARQRFFAAVIVRGEESEGVRLWGFGKMAYKELLNLVLNPEYGDITDLEAGTDLTLVYGKPPGATFPQTKLTPRRRSSTLCEGMTDDQCRELLDAIPDFDTLFERKSTSEVEAILDEFLSTDEVAEDNSSETTKYNEASSVDAAFNQLANS